MDEVVVGDLIGSDATVVEPDRVDVGPRERAGLVGDDGEGPREGRGLEARGGELRLPDVEVRAAGVDGVEAEGGPGEPGGGLADVVVPREAVGAVAVEAVDELERLGDAPG